MSSNSHTEPPPSSNHNEEEETKKAYSEARHCLAQPSHWSSTDVSVPRTTLRVLTADGLVPADDKAGHEAVTSIKELLPQQEEEGQASSDLLVPRGSLVRLLRGVADQLLAHEAAKAKRLPKISKLRVTLLGTSTILPGMVLTQLDLADALLRGLTADWPSTWDPLYEFVSKEDEFNEAWSKLLDESLGDAPLGDRWGVGPLGAWGRSQHLSFVSRSHGEVSAAPYDEDAGENAVALCPGIPPKFGFGLPTGLDSRARIAKVLKEAGHTVNNFEDLHHQMHQASESSPCEMVQKDEPVQGVRASFSRFSPEAGDFQGCGSAFLDIFDVAFRPHKNKSNVGVLLTCVPKSGISTGLSHATFLRALYFTGLNVSRLLREYNAVTAGEEGVSRSERANWRSTDLKVQVEYYFSDRNLLTDSFLKQMLSDHTVWCDLEEITGELATKEEMLAALQESKTVAAKVDADGKAQLRPAPTRTLPDPKLGLSGINKRRLEEAEQGDEKKRRLILGGEPSMEAEDGNGGAQKGQKPEICWNYLKGQCFRGSLCKWDHGLSPDVAAKAAAAAQSQMQSFGLFGKGKNRIFLPGMKGKGSQWLMPGKGQKKGGEEQEEGEEKGEEKQGEGAEALEGDAAGNSSPQVEDGEMTGVGEAEGQASPMEEETLIAVGASVEVCGLAAKTAFNGQVGKVQAFDEITNRWQVQLQDGTILRAKSENLITQQVSSPSNGGLVQEAEPEEGDSASSSWQQPTLKAPPPKAAKAPKTPKAPVTPKPNPPVAKFQTPTSTARGKWGATPTP